MLFPQLLNHRIIQFISATTLSANILIFSSNVCAQIVPDNSLNTKVNLINGQQQITGGQELGSNLFHSFHEFSPQADFITHFDNNSSIENIFTRVTGKNTSLLNGLIRANGDASLFIINPAGIIFGDNADLNIGGSFFATTAESIIFADGTKFTSRVDQSPPLLTVSIPSGLQYGHTPGAISSNNVKPVELTLDAGKTFAFLGGNIQFQNLIIKASSGNIELGSVAENEVIHLSNINDTWKFNYDNVEKFSDIKIQQNTEIDTSGKLGNIKLRGRDILLSTGVDIVNATNLDFEGNERGEISLIATNEIDLDGRIFIVSEVSGFDENLNPLPNPVKGNGGNITISANDVKIRNGSLISAITLSEGTGGNIKINSRDSLELSGFSSSNQFFPSLILTSVNSDGHGGSINIDTGKLIIKDGARIDSSSLGSGDAGNINVNADELIQISGNVNSIDFQGNTNVILSGFAASSGREDFSAPFLGQSGEIEVTTPSLSIDDGGEISVSNFGTKNAGDIEIEVGKLLLKDNSQIISERASGNEGSITISSNEIILKDESTIATTATGTGTGGNIILKADNIVLFDESTINADAHGGDGGRITITTQSLLTQENTEDVITASSQLGIDGEVTINTPDTNSKFETTQARITALAGEEAIYTGCSLGTDFSANKFSYVGRGGMRRGPFDSSDSQEFIADLGLEELNALDIQSIEMNTKRYPNNREMKKFSKSITEATTWVVNKEGRVELITQVANNVFPSGCLFN